MNELIKIKDVAVEYKISARTLRYYEEMGLLESVRNDEYAYRMYDQNAIIQLQKILFLRHLHVSIKDIKKIFHTPGTDVVLDVLSKKASTIDDDVATLYELKEIVLDFIDQIESMDLSIHDNVQELYEKAKTVEDRLERTDSIGSETTAKRLHEINQSLKKMADVRIYEIADCKMVSSEVGMFGDGKLEEFDKWFSQFPCATFPKDYLTSAKGGEGLVWLYVYEKGMVVPENFQILDFTGGLYAVTTGIDGDDNEYLNARQAIYNFIEEKECFELDKTRTELGNVITPPIAQEVMGYGQMDF